MTVDRIDTRYCPACGGPIDVDGRCDACGPKDEEVGGQGAIGRQRCHAPGCLFYGERTLGFCPTHWAELPTMLRSRIEQSPRSAEPGEWWRWVKFAINFFHDAYGQGDLPVRAGGEQ